MYKEITVEFDGIDNYYSVILGNKGLTKTASSVSDEISNFIKTHKFNTDKYLYVLINALGSEEFYGSNKNGDSFPEYYEGKPNLINDGTDYGYKTFEYYAKLYKHHNNKDPKKSYGDVLLSIYNYKMHRVELIVRMDRSKAPNECQKVERGEVLSTSMGTKVPYDVCSICGNKSKTRAQYCYHLKKMMGKILPNGEKVFAINPKPKFFDISMVFVPADVTSRVIKKIASVKGASNKVAVEKKHADIKKEVPATAIESTTLSDIIDKIIQRKTRELERREPRIPNEVIDSMCKFPLKSIMSTMISCGIMPKPEEFQRIVLIKIRKPSLANMLERQNLVFNINQAGTDPDVLRSRLPLSIRNIEPKLISMIKGLMPLRSRWQPFLLSRLNNFNKFASQNTPLTSDNVLPVMSAVSDLYLLMKNSAPSLVASQIYNGVKSVIKGILAGVVLKNMISNTIPKKSEKTIFVDDENLSANELLKISNVENIVNDLFFKKYAKLIVNASKQNIDSDSLNKLYLINKAIESESGIKTARVINKALLGIPAMSILVGSNLIDRKAGKKTSKLMDIIGDHPVASTAAGVAALNYAPSIAKKILSKTASRINNILTDEYSSEMIYKDGDLLNVATLIKMID